LATFTGTKFAELKFRPFAADHIGIAHERNRRFACALFVVYQVRARSEALKDHFVHDRRDVDATTWS
jgi:hypothetical protein